MKPDLQKWAEERALSFLQESLTSSPVSDLLKALPGGIGAIAESLLPRVLEFVKELYEYAQAHELPVVIEAKTIIWKEGKLE